MSIIKNILKKISLPGRKTEDSQAVAKICLKDPRRLEKIRACLKSDETKVQAEGAEVMAEIAKLKPELIAPHTNDFLGLLSSSNDRVLMASLVALNSLAPLKTQEIYTHQEKILELGQKGISFIKEEAISLLAFLAASSPDYAREIAPSLFQLLESCLPRDIPRYGEFILKAVMREGSLKENLKTILERRISECDASGRIRVKKILREVG